jgi:hypothetical protein
VPGPFDCSRQLALVSHTIAGDTPRDDPTPLSEKISQQPDIFEIDRSLVDTKSTRPATLKKAPAATSVSVSALLLFTLHKPSPSVSESPSACLVCLVCMIHLVCLVYSVCLVFG